MIKRAWLWIGGVVLALLGAVGIVTAIERRRAKKTNKDLARELADRARERARTNLDAAVADGVANIEEADRAAEEAVNGSGSLADYLIKRDPGPDHD